MFSTPLICSSMGATTVVATTSALAPGYWPCTLMMGGAISGYCATGKRQNDTRPRMMKTIETTEAKIGRSMKKCEIFIPGASFGLCLGGTSGGRRRGGRRPTLLLRGDLGARTGPHEAVDDDMVVGGNARFDDAQVVVDFAQGHVFLAHRIVGTDDQHVFARLLGADGGVGNEQRVVWRRARKLHAREHARREQAV